LSLGDLFSIPPTLSLPLLFLAHFEIAAVHAYPHSRPPPPTAPRLTPSPPSAAAESPSEPTSFALVCLIHFRSPFLSCPPSPSVAIRRHRRVIRLAPLASSLATSLLPPRPLSLISVLQCPAVAADQTHKLIELICPYEDMVYLSCFSCVPSPSLFAFIDAFHSCI